MISIGRVPRDRQAVQRAAPRRALAAQSQEEHLRESARIVDDLCGTSCVRFLNSMIVETH